MINLGFSALPLRPFFAEALGDLRRSVPDATDTFAELGFRDIEPFRPVPNLPSFGQTDLAGIFRTATFQIVIHDASSGCAM
jgi:hypothetical protein